MVKKRIIQMFGYVKQIHIYYITAKLTSIIGFNNLSLIQNTTNLLDYYYGLMDSENETFFNKHVLPK